MHTIEKSRSNIDPYDTSNKLEFFYVASEYFFERPQMIAKKHQKLYQALEDIYQQDRAAIVSDIKNERKKSVYAEVARLTESVVSRRIDRCRITTTEVNRVVGS